MSETPSITLMLVIERRDTGASLETLFRRAISADVHLFNDYAAASAALSNSVVDLLVIDLGGDNAPGTRLIRQTRSNLRLRLTPIVAITTACFDETKPEVAYQSGANVVMHMPVSFDELNNEVAKLLRLKTDPDVAMSYTGVETQGFDYKEAIKLESKDSVASLAKDVIAMANWGGGLIIVGFREIRPGEFSPVGVALNDLPLYEPTRLNKALSDFLDPAIAVSVRRISDEKFTFVCLTVPGSRQGLILAKKENVSAGLYKGRIYSRTVRIESAQLESAEEIRSLIKRYITRAHDDRQNSAQIGIANASWRVPKGIPTTLSHDRLMQRTLR
jgi:CheY-like chemotaxis protein